MDNQNGQIYQDCPFCGSKDKELQETRTHAFVQCSLCFARGPLIFKQDNDFEKETIKAWNDWNET